MEECHIPESCSSLLLLLLCKPPILAQKPGCYVEKMIFSALDVWGTMPSRQYLLPYIPAAQLVVDQAWLLSYTFPLSCAPLAVPLRPVLFA